MTSCSTGTSHENFAAVSASASFLRSVAELTKERFDLERVDPCVSTSYEGQGP